MKLTLSLVLLAVAHLTGCTTGSRDGRRVYVLGFGVVETSTNSVADVVSIRSVGVSASNIGGLALSAGVTSTTVVEVKTNNVTIDLRTGTLK